jgi:RHS repeat-associated protein
MQYTLPDVNGNIIALTNSTATVTDLYATDPFGDYYTHTGTSTQPFSFLGMYGVQRDISGLYYDWARYYDAHIGRFLSKDPYPQNSMSTQGVNSFGYGLNNPISFIDATGLISINNTSYSYGYLNNQDCASCEFLNRTEQSNTQIDIFSKVLKKSSIFNFENLGSKISHVTGPVSNLFNFVELSNSIKKDNQSLGKNTQRTTLNILGGGILTKVGMTAGGAAAVIILAPFEVGAATVVGVVLASRYVGGLIGNYFGSKIGDLLIR